MDYPWVVARIVKVGHVAEALCESVFERLNHGAAVDDVADSDEADRLADAVNQAACPVLDVARIVDACFGDGDTERVLSVVAHDRQRNGDTAEIVTAAGADDAEVGGRVSRHADESPADVFGSSELYRLILYADRADVEGRFTERVVSVAKEALVIELFGFLAVVSRFLFRGSGVRRRRCLDRRGVVVDRLLAVAASGCPDSGQQTSYREPRELH